MRCFLMCLVVFCSLWRGSSANAIKQFSLLDNDENARRISVLNDAGESLDGDDSKRLLNFDKRIAYSMNVCCFYGNILDFYVTDVLNTNENLPHLVYVRENLHRFSQDLKAKGCSALQGNDQELIRKFKEEFHKMGKPGLYKAVGELGSLVYDLHLYC